MVKTLGLRSRGSSGRKAMFPRKGIASFPLLVSVNIKDISFIVNLFV